MLAAAEVYAAEQPGDDHHAVHPRRRDGADHLGRRRGADARRGARRHDVRAARPTRRAGGLRVVRQLDVDADRGADVRHARAGDSCCTPWPRSPAGSACRSARAARCTASKLPDAQAAYESAATLHPTMLGGVNFVLHAAGWLEGGLAIGYEKFVLDCDQLGMMATFVKGLDLSENGQALDAIRENPPGQHFLGTAHTLANFEIGVLPLRHRRQLELRAVDRGRRARRRPARQPALEGAARRLRAAPASTTRSTTSCSSSSPAARPSCRTRSPENRNTKRRSIDVPAEPTVRS